MNETIKKINAWVQYIGSIASWASSGLSSFPSKPDLLKKRREDNTTDNPPIESEQRTADNRDVSTDNEVSTSRTGGPVDSDSSSDGGD